MAELSIISGYDLVTAGIEIEKNGWEFYARMAKKAKDSGVKDVFNFLAKEENKHIDKFRQILNQFNAYAGSVSPAAESYPDEYSHYIKQLAAQYVFTKPHITNRLIRRVTTDAAALDMAIDFEKDSILFYSEMRPFLREAERLVLEQLIEEERRHFLKLSRKRKNPGRGNRGLNRN